MDTVTESRLCHCHSDEKVRIGIIQKIYGWGTGIRRGPGKESQSGVITHPFTLSPNPYPCDAEELMSRYEFRCSHYGLEHGILVRILNKPGLRFEENFYR
jgi:hypothetical protein